MSHIVERPKIAIIGKDYGFTKELVREFSRAGAKTLAISKTRELGNPAYIQKVVSIVSQRQKPFDVVITGVRNSDVEQLTESDRSGFLLACELVRLGIPVIILSTSFYRKQAMESGCEFVDVAAGYSELAHVVSRLLSKKGKEE